MPEINLVSINPRIAIASIAASIALQEAAVSHVLNAQGEGIQAVVGLAGVTVGQLQDVNLSVGDMVDNVAAYTELLREKLQTALDALYPSFTMRVYFADNLTSNPVNCECAMCQLLNNTTFESTTFVSTGEYVTLTGLAPGSYTLNMSSSCPGYAVNETAFDIEVGPHGAITFDGQPVTEGTPAVVPVTRE